MQMHRTRAPFFRLTRLSKAPGRCLVRSGSIQSRSAHAPKMALGWYPRSVRNCDSVAGMMASEVKGFGRQKGQTEIYRGAEYATNMVPKVKVEVALADSLADQAVEAIREAANMGSIGDGKIFVLDLQSALRIRTGETGETAL